MTQLVAGKTKMEGTGSIAPGYVFIANIKRDKYDYPLAGFYTRKSDAFRGLKRYMRRTHRAVSGLIIQREDGTSTEFLVEYNRKFIKLKDGNGNINTYKFSY